MPMWSSRSSARAATARTLVRPGAMREHVANRDPLFSARRELRPVGGHRLVVVESAAIGQAVDRLSRRSPL